MKKELTVDNKILPRALHKGDRIGLVATANRPGGPIVLKRCEKIVEEMGFIPVTGRHVLNINGSMAGLDSERACDLNSFIADDSLAGIFCLSGGWGSLRLLPLLDFEPLRRNPKIIVGGDDNCSLLLAINSLTGLVVFNGLNLDQIKSKESFDAYEQCLTSNEIQKPLKDRSEPAFTETTYAPVEGIGEGVICASNLTALVSLFGTPYEPALKDKLLLLEDVNEKYSMLERWFSTLYLSTQLQQTRAVGFGYFPGCGPKGAENALPIEEVFSNYLRKLATPSCFGMQFGQVNPAPIVPVGIRGRLDCSQGILEFLEPALTN